MKIAMLTGGGPAPGFNGVINAATLSAAARGWEVLGIPHGYARLMAGDVDAVRPLTPERVAGIETRGGSILYTSRANPIKEKASMARVVETVRSLGIDAIITIGGDDTASAAAAVAEAVGGIRVAHVPKTIDNDLPLPGETPTFGFETAKALGSTLCRNLRVDAETTGRWYLVSAMGRSAGHLALGMGMGSGADLTLIPEEFENGVSLDAVAAVVENAILKRRAAGQRWGLAILGEGILDRLDPADLKKTVGEMELDEHGNPRMSEIDLGRIVRDVLVKRLAKKQIKTGFVTKLIGYELRCADPIAFDIQYTRNLGAAAVEFLATGKGNGIITIHDGRVKVLRFEDIRDQDGRVPVRRVDLDGAAWKAALAVQAR